MELMSIGKFAKMVGVTPTTLRRMHQRGDFIPYYITKSGTRYYAMEQLKEFSGAPQNEKIIVGYCRVAGPGHKKELDTQVDNVKSYMFAKGYKFEIVTDMGAATDCQRKGLRDLLTKINNHEISKVVVLHKDRLLRFGFDLISYICEINGVEIEVIDATEEGREQELTEDLIQTITDLGNTLYGPRAKKTKILLEAVRQNAKSDNDQSAGSQN